jgi:hypothetical protein
MKPDPQPDPSDFERRTAAQEQHARDARANIEKARRPSEVLTADERATLERSKGAAR